MLEEEEGRISCAKVVIIFGVWEDRGFIVTWGVGGAAAVLVLHEMPVLLSALSQS